QSLHSSPAGVDPGAPALASARGARAWTARPGVGPDPGVTQPGASRVPSGCAGFRDRNFAERRSSAGVQAAARAAHVAVLGAEPHFFSSYLALRGKDAAAQVHRTRWAQPAAWPVRQ